MRPSAHRTQFETPQNGAAPGPQVASISSSTAQRDLEMIRVTCSTNGPEANSTSSRITTPSVYTHHNSATTRTHTGGYRATKNHVRALPPWLSTYEDDEDAQTERNLRQTPVPPIKSHVPEPNQTSEEVMRRISQDGYIDVYDDASRGLNERKPETGFFGGPREPVKGRKWDHVRDGDPVIVQTRAINRILPWRGYIESSSYKLALNEKCTRTDNLFLDQQTPGYLAPWRGDLERIQNIDSHSGLAHMRKQRKTIFKRIQYYLLMHPLVPLLFRLVVLTTSVSALAIAASVHHLSNKYNYEQTPSSTMAIVVEVVAIPYILYITWDEYTGKPLGLRGPGAKIRLVLLDLFFIIFESANLSLAFGTLKNDNGSCESSDNGVNHIICNRVKALCGILMLALGAWSLTFTISIFRLVQRVGGKEEE